MQPNQQPQTPPQKLVDFNLEFEALCKKYQYDVRPVIVFAESAVVAQIKVFDVSPKTQEGVKLNADAPAPEKPAEPETAPLTPEQEAVAKARENLQVN